MTQFLILTLSVMEIGLFIDGGDLCSKSIGKRE